MYFWVSCTNWMRGNQRQKRTKRFHGGQPFHGGKIGAAKSTAPFLLRGEKFGEKNSRKMEAKQNNRRRKCVPLLMCLVLKSRVHSSTPSSTDNPLPPHITSAEPCPTLSPQYPYCYPQPSDLSDQEAECRRHSYSSNDPLFHPCQPCYPHRLLQHHQQVQHRQ